ncbi:MAG TPA: GNAT family N-acetyltransferase [Allosphingosinicella sp.]|nr:GNAT family N-acetyltransferase [Allosphingosinicella sp.]
MDVRLIRPGDRLRGLSLGDPAFTPLKIFLQKHALDYERQSLARTYGAFRVNPRKVAGYVTLVCGEVITDDGDQCLVAGLKYRYKQYPAVKIARLAVDQTVQGLGLGKALVDLALGIAKREISPSVGCRFVVVDSKRNAVPFYERCGFTLLDTTANRERDEPVMFVDLNKVD